MKIEKWWGRMMGLLVRIIILGMGFVILSWFFRKNYLHSDS